MSQLSQYSDAELRSELNRRANAELRARYDADIETTRFIEQLDRKWATYTPEFRRYLHLLVQDALAVGMHSAAWRRVLSWPLE